MKAILSCCVLVLVITACALGPAAETQERSVQITDLPLIEDTPTSVPAPSNTPRPTRTPFRTLTKVPTSTEALSTPTVAARAATATSKPAATATSKPAAATKQPTKSKPPTATKEVKSGGNCSPAYPTVCIPPPPPDLDCKDVKFKRFKVLPPDPHKFDRDKNGIGCES